MSEFPELIPARMVSDYVYCPRSCYLEWVQQRWEWEQVQQRQVLRQQRLRAGRLR